MMHRGRPSLPSDTLEGARGVAGKCVARYGIVNHTSSNPSRVLRLHR
jgi:hypothetical protein